MVVRVLREDLVPVQIRVARQIKKLTKSIKYNGTI